MTQTIVSKTPEDTEKIAQAIALGLHDGIVIGLYGDLGTGKTTFSKALAKALNIEKPVQSPTFVLMRQYEMSHHTLKTLYHLDLYRLESYENDELGLTELFEDASALIIIEWADRAKHMLPDRRIDISFTHEGDDRRRVVIDDRR